MEGELNAVNISRANESPLATSLHSSLRILAIQEAAAAHGQSMETFSHTSTYLRASLLLSQRSHIELRSIDYATIRQVLAEDRDEHTCLTVANIPFDITPLNINDSLCEFDCTSSALNEWLIKYALICQLMEINTTYTLKNNGNLQGYYTLSNEIFRLISPNPNDASSLSAKVLLRLAVNTYQQGKGLGTHLVLDCFSRFAANTEEHDVLLVQAQDHSLVHFYTRLGFSQIDNDVPVLFITRSRAINALERHLRCNDKKF